MTYTPNFQDARVQRRCRQALGFACGAISATNSHAWSTRYIDKWFGVQSNPLSAYLRQQLLVVTNHHWNKDKGECKQYVLNSPAVQQLKQDLGIASEATSNIVLQVVNKTYEPELASGQFVYRDKSSRLWHPLQNFRRDTKRSVLNSAGYHYHYDIECCAMTLIHQHSQRIPEVVVEQKWQQGPMDLYLFALRRYLQNRTEIRDQIAQEADLDSATVKRIINALLAGAPLSLNPATEINKMLGGDRARIQFLKQHEYLSQLRADIKMCWDYIKPTLPRRSKTQTTGRERMIPISSRQKWGVYFDLERQVLDSVRDYLVATSNKHFLEHDGWSCASELDQVALQQWICNQTGFVVEIELERSLERSNTSSADADSCLI